jgi:iron only hydrogenase large subunit-like protein
MIREQWVEEPADEKRTLVSVLVTSCIAAKSEASREKISGTGSAVIDLVLTPRELIKWIRLIGLSVERLQPLPGNVPDKVEQGAGILAGLAGGQSEALIRNYYFSKTGKPLSNNRLRRFRINRPYREFLLEAGEDTLHIGTVSGLSHAVEVFRQLDAGKLSLDYLEVMACPSGCINGGGQPYPFTEESLRNRTRFLYDLLGYSGFVPFQQNDGFAR